MAGTRSTQPITLKERVKYVAEAGVLFASDTDKDEAEKLILALNKFKQQRQEKRGDCRSQEEIMREDLQLQNHCARLKVNMEEGGIRVLVYVGFPPELKSPQRESRGIVVRGVQRELDKVRSNLKGEDGFQLGTRKICYHFHADDERSSLSRLQQELSRDRFFLNPYHSRYHTDTTDPEINEDRDLLNNAETLRYRWLIKQGNVAAAPVRDVQGL